MSGGTRSPPAYLRRGGAPVSEIGLFMSALIALWAPYGLLGLAQIALIPLLRPPRVRAADS